MAKSNRITERVIPSVFTLDWLARRWSVKKKDFNSTIGQFIKNDKLKVYVDYQGYAIEEEYKYYKECFTSPKDGHFYTKFKWREEYNELKDPSKNNFPIRRIGWGTEEEINIDKKLDDYKKSETNLSNLSFLRKQELMYQNFNDYIKFMPSYINVHYVVWMGNSGVQCDEDGYLVFYQLYSNITLKTFSPLEKKGEDEDSLFRVKWERLDPKKAWVTREDLKEFEQRMGICDHGLKPVIAVNNKPKKPSLNEQRIAFFKDYIANKEIKGLIKKEVWEELKKANPSLFKAGDDDFFKVVKKKGIYAFPDERLKKDS